MMSEAVGSGRRSYVIEGLTESPDGPKMLERTRAALVAVLSREGHRVWRPGAAILVVIAPPSASEAFGDRAVSTYMMGDDAEPAKARGGLGEILIEQFSGIPQRGALEVVQGLAATLAEDPPEGCFWAATLTFDDEGLAECACVPVRPILLCKGGSA